MKLYKVETGIKLPAESTGGKKTVAGPSMAATTISVLDVGESFLIKDGLDAHKASKVLNDLNKREKRKKDGRQFASRGLADGLRIWRVK